MGAFYDEDNDRIHGGRIFAAILGVVVLLSVVGTILGFANGWFQAGTKIVSAPHVEAQYDKIISDWNELTTAADNACAAQKQTGSGDTIFSESPAFAYAATYRNIRTEYNSAQQNIFDAKLVGPPGYPKNIPNFKEATGENPNFCEVSTALADMQG